VIVANGVRPGRAGADDLTLAVHRSAPLQRVVRDMNRDSDNYTAELVLKTLGAVAGEGGSTAAGARVVLEELRDADVDTYGVRIADRSGLSGLDRLTAVSLVQVIVVALREPDVRAPFLASLAVAGRNGTLRDRLGAVRPVVRGKTGTTNISSSLSGVIGDSIAFAVMQNGSPVASWAARSAQDRFVTVLAGSLPTAG
jgi:PBP4 family serine-type D-alanyl-D-alanine carboxypeptidase